MQVIIFRTWLFIETNWMNRLSKICRKIHRVMCIFMLMFSWTDHWVSLSVQIWLCGGERWSGWERPAGREVLWEDRSLSCGLLWEPALHQVCVWLRDSWRWLLHPLRDLQNGWVERKRKWYKWILEPLLLFYNKKDMCKVGIHCRRA